jgi:hypothetical protein
LNLIAFHNAEAKLVWPKFAVWMLVDSEWGVVRFARSARSKEAIRDVAALYARIAEGGEVGIDEWKAAAAAAARSSAAAASCAVSAATAYIYTYDYAFFGDAANAAANTAANYAAEAHAAGAFAYASSYGIYKHQKVRAAQADKLLELMSAAPLPHV